MDIDFDIQKQWKATKERRKKEKASKIPMNNKDKERKKKMEVNFDPIHITEKEIRYTEPQYKKTNKIQMEVKRNDRKK